MFENIHPKRRWQSGECQMVANIHLRIDFTRFWKEVENSVSARSIIDINLLSAVNQL